MVKLFLLLVLSLECVDLAKVGNIQGLREFEVTRSRSLHDVAMSFHRCDVCPPPVDHGANFTVTFKVIGRLGNQMLGYAIMLGLTRVFGCDTYLEPHVLDNLNFYFEGIEGVQPMEASCMENAGLQRTEVKRGPIQLETTQRGADKSFKIPHNIALIGKRIIEKQRWDNVFTKIQDELRHSFVMRRRFTDKAQEVLHDVAADYVAKRPKQKRKGKAKKIDVTFVGIHVRRTDYDRVIKLFNLPPIPTHYYVTAIDFFYERFKHPIFLVVGDDMEWVRNNLASRTGFSSVFPVGSGQSADREAIAADLAILSQCNHTILSYGSYSFWAGFMAGGKRIIPSMVINMSGQRKNPLDLVLPPFIMTDQAKYSYTVQ